MTCDFRKYFILNTVCTRCDNHFVLSRIVRQSSKNNVTKRSIHLIVLRTKALSSLDSRFVRLMSETNNMKTIITIIGHYRLYHNGCMLYTCLWNKKYRKSLSPQAEP